MTGVHILFVDGLVWWLMHFECLLCWGFLQEEEYFVVEGHTNTGFFIQYLILLVISAESLVYNKAETKLHRRKQYRHLNTFCIP
jgi:hypothetical protein